jgi:hypothetical protein
MLEDRCLPAVNFAVFGSTLVAFAPTAPNQGGASIIFRDNGSQSAGNVTAISAAPFTPQVAITDVIVLMTGPNESVSYFLTGNLTGTRNVSVSLMKGTDTFAAVVNGNLQAKSSLSFFISASPSTVNGVRGTAQITGLVSGSVLTGASLSWTAVTTAGNSFLSFLESGSVAAGATVFVGQFGGSAMNTINTFYVGQMNGQMSVFTVGGPKNDALTTDLEFLAGGHGTLNPSLILGQGGDDNLRFLIHNANPGVLLTTAVLDGGSGNNTGERTSNVLSFNCQSDTVVP